jgi:hypothetical protein
VLNLRSVIRNPFSFLFARSSAEERCAEYIVREHASGRSLDAIMTDSYIKNRLTPAQQRRLLDRPELIHAIGHQDIESARSAAEG